MSDHRNRRFFQSLIKVHYRIRIGIIKIATFFRICERERSTSMSRITLTTAYTTSYQKILTRNMSS